MKKRTGKTARMRFKGNKGLRPCCLDYNTKNQGG